MWLLNIRGLKEFITSCPSLYQIFHVYMYIYMYVLLLLLLLFLLLIQRFFIISHSYEVSIEDMAVFLPFFPHLSYSVMHRADLNLCSI